MPTRCFSCVRRRCARGGQVRGDGSTPRLHRNEACVQHRPRAAFTVDTSPETRRVLICAALSHLKPTVPKFVGAARWLCSVDNIRTMRRRPAVACRARNVDKVCPCASPEAPSTLQHSMCLRRPAESTRPNNSGNMRCVALYGRRSTDHAADVSTEARGRVLN